MGIDWAAALAALAAKAAVGSLIQGREPDRGVLADLAKQVIDVLLRQDASLARKIDNLGRKIDAIPAREFAERMGAGRRYLRDLPAEWRNDQDRRELIRYARDKFVDAVAIAEHMQDVERQALAEVAIAGCWLWVPSLPDVKNTVGVARTLLEEHILFGAPETYQPPGPPAPSLFAAYRDVLRLCKAYGERPPATAIPITPSASDKRKGRVPEPVLTVIAPPDQWVECVGVEVQIRRTPRDGQVMPWLLLSTPSFSADVRNTRSTSVRVHTKNDPDRGYRHGEVVGNRIHTLQPLGSGAVGDPTGLWVDVPRTEYARSRSPRVAILLSIEESDLDIPYGVETARPKSIEGGRRTP